MAAYYIEIEHRQLADGRTIYGVKVGQQMRKSTMEPGDGLGSAYTPADTYSEAVANVRSTLATYRDPANRMDGRPEPRPENTELRDATGEFSRIEFFDSGTLAAYMQEGS